VRASLSVLLYFSSANFNRAFYNQLFKLFHKNRRIDNLYKYKSINLFVQENQNTMIPKPDNQSSSFILRSSNGSITNSFSSSEELTSTRLAFRPKNYNNSYFTTTAGEQKVSVVSYEAVEPSRRDENGLRSALSVSPSSRIRPRPEEDFVTPVQHAGAVTAQNCLTPPPRPCQDKSCLYVSVNAPIPRSLYLPIL